MSSDLTPGLAEVIEAAVGLDQTLKILREYGGLEWKVPTERRVAGTQLAKLLGEQDALAVVRALGPGNVVLPMAAVKGLGGRRGRAMRMIRDTNASNTTIARECDVHLRSVSRYRAELADDRQMQLPLFDE